MKVLQGLEDHVALVDLEHLEHLEHLDDQEILQLPDCLSLLEHHAFLEHLDHL